MTLTAQLHAEPKAARILAEALESGGLSVVSQGGTVIVWDGAGNFPASDLPCVQLGGDKHSKAVAHVSAPVRLQELIDIVSRMSVSGDVIAVQSPIVLDMQQRELKNTESGESWDLTEKEAALLAALLGGERSRDALLKQVWGYSDEAATHTLETHIYRLRGKLNEALGEADWIETAEAGYRLAGVR